MMKPFTDRKDAGARLAAEMHAYRDDPDVIILGLPRGGVVVAAEVAKALDAPMDVFTVRKLGVPGHPELAMGAVATGGVRVLNRSVIEQLGIPDRHIDSVTAAEQKELERRETAYRLKTKPVELEGKTAVLTDDGLATGSTMLAAVRAVKEQKARRVVVAVPVAAPDSLKKIEAEVNAVHCLMAPASFMAVGRWYEQFEQTGDDEVRELMSRQQEKKP
jgi:putative phosphoribosyl transferase